MTNEEIKSRMWKAYKAGLGVPLDSSDEGNYLVYRVRFNKWLAENFPEVANAEAPYFDKRAEGGHSELTYTKLNDHHVHIGREKDDITHPLT